MIHEGTNGGAGGRQTHQRMEGGNGLWQGNGTDLQTHDDTSHTANGQEDGTENQIALGHVDHGGRHGAEDTHHTEFAPRVGGGHRRQAPNGRHTQQRRHGAHRLQELGSGQRHEQEDQAREEHHGCVVLVPRLFEEVQHALRHHEAAEDVHCRDQQRQGGQEVGERRSRLLHQQQTTNGRATRDGIGHRHQRRVQGVGHAPDGLVACGTGQQEGSQQGGLHTFTHGQHAANAKGQHKGAYSSCLQWIFLYHLLLRGRSGFGLHRRWLRWGGHGD
mmetsp:Transcript_60833/g.133264  ORF Transcript_60833/g.133264 Transcript_60833/m.133264 type:complete len:274 (+) Transcript_60833:1296-2117(+)